MKTAQELYPNLYDAEDDWFDAPYDYKPMLENLCDELLLKVDDRDYSGDSRVLMRDASGRYGLLIFGWGSCSGCDALQSCRSYEEIQLLMDHLALEIHWEDSAALMHSYITHKDWELEYSWNAKETRVFVDQALAILANSSLT